MEIHKRKDAQRLGVGQYFTGKPCKHGHLANRYTQSGACVACVAASASAARGGTHSGVVIPREQREAERQAKVLAAAESARQRMNALLSLATIAVPVHSADMATVFDTAVELCLAKHPNLTREDVQPSAAIIRPGTPLRAVRVPPEHERLMHDIANTLWNAHGVDMGHIRHRIVQQAEHMAAEEEQEPPEHYK